MNDSCDSLYNTLVYILGPGTSMPKGKNGPRVSLPREDGSTVWVIASWCELETNGLPRPFKYKKGFHTISSLADRDLKLCLNRADEAGDYCQSKLV